MYSCKLQPYSIVNFFFSLCSFPWKQFLWIQCAKNTHTQAHTQFRFELSTMFYFFIDDDDAHSSSLVASCSYRSHKSSMMSSLSHLNGLKIPSIVEFSLSLSLFILHDVPCHRSCARFCVKCNDNINSNRLPYFINWYEVRISSTEFFR